MNHTVSAKLYFTDIDTTHPNFLAIDSLTDQNIINGYTIDGKKFFRALQPVNRAEAVKTILLTAEINPEVKTSSFSDIHDNDWYAPYIGTAQYFEFVNGFSDGNFHPQSQVTRAEFLSILLKAFQVPIETKDNQDWFTPLFEFANAYNLIDTLEISPHQALTRGEVVEIAYRLRNVAEKDFSTPYIYAGTGSISYYNEGFAGKKTANGEIYDPQAMTAAHRTLPFGTRLKVWEINNPDKSVIVRITDRGPYHSSRVIDLSEKAFANLAPVSRGVIEAGFEVFSDEELAIAPLSVPTEIESEFTKDALPPLVPTEIIPELSTATEAEKEKYTLPSNTELKIQPLFSGSTAYIPVDFYEKVTLRKNFPQKIQTGTITLINGRTNESGAKEVTVFLQKINEEQKALETQISFTAAVNFQNFSIPVRFLESGTYQMGIVLDDNRRSKVAEIEVLKSDTIRKYNDPETDFSTDFTLNVIPEKEIATVTWAKDFGLKRINKLEIRPFDSAVVTNTLLIENGLNTIDIPYEFFVKAAQESGGKNEKWAFDLYAATSLDETIVNQNSRWKKVAYQNFALIPGFTDTESEKFSLQDFERFPDKAYEIYTGHLKQNAQARDYVLITKPNGVIDESKTVRLADDAFQFRVDFDQTGTYVIEVIATDGEILFNRAVYNYPETVLPVLSWFRQKANVSNVMGVKNWINAFRQSRGVSAIFTNAELNDIAQVYAEKMATENFIGHVSPTGITFEDRIKQAGLNGEYAENVAFGSTFQLALDGLQDSASHFRNIVHRKWTKVGIGIAKNDDGYFVVQIFSH